MKSLGVTSKKEEKIVNFSLFFPFLLSQQAEEEKRGVRITQGKPFLKRGSSNRSSGSFRRRSIRLTKTEAGMQQPISRQRVKARDSDAECKS